MFRGRPAQGPEQRGTDQKIEHCRADEPAEDERCHRLKDFLARLARSKNQRAYWVIPLSFVVVVA